MTRINRRSILTSAAAVPAAAALGTVPAIAGTDPIFGLIAEADRLYALGKAADARLKAAEESVGDDCWGSGQLPLDMSKPELRVMVPWLEREYRRAPWPEGDGISLRDIERFNDELERSITHGRYGFIAQAAGRALVAPTVEDAYKMLIEAAERLREMGPELTEDEERTLARYQREGAARLAWWDERNAERQRNTEHSGVRLLAEQSEAAWDAWCDANAAILEAHPITLAGVVAQLAVAASVIRQDIPKGEGEEGIDMVHIATLRAHEALVRLTRRAA